MLARNVFVGTLFFSFHYVVLRLLIPLSEAPHPRPFQAIVICFIPSSAELNIQERKVNFSVRLVTSTRIEGGKNLAKHAQNL